ncbi:MAG: hypothetical protein HY961_02030 [Ignavibacteriae bacterium]|nr:hypothetical protein [Ignavibacteriota bacterium]
MPTNLRLSMVVAFVTAIIALSCNKNEVVISDNGGTNAPAVASTRNAFGYSIGARQLTTTQTYPLTFTANKLSIAAAASNIAQGEAIFTLLNQTGGVIRSDTFRLAGMYQVLIISGLPASITTKFQNFTGSVQYAIAGDTTPEYGSDFPNTRGTQWTYARFDSLASRRDTVVVTVFGQVTFNGRPATIWQQAARSRTDTIYVSVSGDTVRMYNFPFSSSTNSKYIFPLYVGKGWRGDFLYDSSTVTLNGAIPTPAGQFTNGFLVQEEWSTFNDYGHFETWLVPRVGIVKQYRREWGFGLQKETWELLSYHINTGIE